MEKKRKYKPGWSGSPRRRDPEMYFGHVYIDKTMFEAILMFADWTNLTIKSATYQLLRYGFQYYINAQLRLEMARRANQPPPKFSQLPAVDELKGFILNLKRNKKEKPEQ